MGEARRSMFHGRRSRRRSAGLSLVEVLVSLAITAALFAAVALAIDASFHAYAVAAESASTQTSTRLVTHRLLALMRTSTAHGPLLPDPSSSPPVNLVGDTLHSHYIELIDPRGNYVRVEYRADSQELWVVTQPLGSSTATAQPLLGGVTQAEFVVKRRMDDQGVWVLERGSIDVTVQPDLDATLPLEAGNTPPIRIIASTMPRKLE